MLRKLTAAFLIICLLFSFAHAQKIAGKKDSTTTMATTTKKTFTCSVGIRLSSNIYNPNVCRVGSNRIYCA